MRRSAAAVCAVVACVSFAHAATDEEIWGALRFPPTLTGVRYASLGSAGIALVDDAAAILVNPSRLPAARDQEILFEARAGDPDATRRDSGLRRFDPSVHPFAGSTFREEGLPDDMSSGLIAWSYPLPIGAPVVIGGALQRSEASFEAVSRVNTVPLSAPVAPDGGDEVLRISTGALDRTTTTLTIAAGWAITSDLWVGVSAATARAEIDGATTGALADPLQFTGPGMFDPRFGTAVPEPMIRTVTDGTDRAPAFSFGAFFRPHPAVGLSTVWRQGPRWEIPARSIDLVTGRTTRFTSTVKEPDRAAIGIAWSPFHARPSATLRSVTIVLDVERVSYSDLVEDLVAGQNILTSPDFVGAVSYDAEDAVEVHLGVEWRYLYRAWSLALRAGAYTDDNASIALSRIAGDVGALQGQSAVLAREGFFEEGDPEPHATAGIGVIFHELSFDLGVDVSDPHTRILLSSRYRFR